MLTIEFNSFTSLRFYFTFIKLIIQFQIKRRQEVFFLFKCNTIFCRIFFLIISIISFGRIIMIDLIFFIVAFVEQLSTNICVMPTFLIKSNTWFVHSSRNQSMLPASILKSFRFFCFYFFFIELF